MNTGKNRVGGLKTELFKKKYQTNPVVSNPSYAELKGRDLTVPTQNFEENFAKELAYRKANPLTLPKTYSAAEVDLMKKNFPMTSEDFLTPQSYGITGIPDLTEGQGINDSRNLNQILADTEQVTSTPQSLRNFQKDDFNQRVKETAETTSTTTPPPDFRNYIRAGVYAATNIKSAQQDAQTRMATAEKLQNLNDQPRFMPNEYDFMGRPGSQSVIYARHGAEIRTGTSSGAEEAELEQGEMFMMPNLDSYVVGGKKHSQGGEDFVLPEGTIVYSDYLKVPGTKKTFAQMAKGYDITKYKEVLDNPHAKAVDRETADIMMNRNMKKLQELFAVQQGINGNSNGETNAKVSAQAGMNYQGVPFKNRTTPTNFEDYIRSNQDINRSITPVVDDPNANLPQVEVMDPLNLAARTTLNQLGVKQTPRVALAPNNPSLEVQSATEQLGGTQAGQSESGTTSKGNAADSQSAYRKTLPNGRTVYVEGQGEFANKNYRNQYGADIFNLVRNRLNENYDELSPALMSAYQSNLTTKTIGVSSPEQLVDVMESGNGSLVSMRNYFKTIGKEDELFDPKLDQGKFNNMAQKRTAELFKQYVESPQYAADVKAGKASTYIPWLKTQPKLSADGKYTLASADIDQEFTQNYQAAYKSFTAIKKSKPELLKGFRVAPEGLNDHQYMGLPISPVDSWGGNTTIGQISAFEDEEPVKDTPPEKPVLKGDPGSRMDIILKEQGKGEYIKAPFDFPQLAPELYGAAASEMFAYTPLDFNAPYLMPQTLNIQPQLQDTNNGYMAALNAGADPNSALIATLGARQRIYSEKQNFDAQQRAATDQANANSRWQEDVYDMQSLDRVYNGLIAQADDARTSQLQALVESASVKRATYNAEENKKALYINNFVRNYKIDGKTGAITIKPGTVMDLATMGELIYNNPNTAAIASNTSNTSTTAATAATDATTSTNAQ